MARYVEVLKVEGVVPYLIPGIRCETRSATLELDWENGRTRNHDCVHPAPKPGDLEFEEQRAVDRFGRALQEVDRFLPSESLLRLDRVGVCSHQEPEDFS